MFPEISTTAPNSPTARANASATPDRIAGRRLGKTIRRKIADERPGDGRPRNGIDKRAYGRSAEAQLEGGDGLRPRRLAPELVEPAGARAPDKCGERQQDDEAEVADRDASRERAPRAARDRAG